MRERDYVQDLVVLFDASGAAVEQELSMMDFEGLCRGERALPERSDERVRAAYVTVAPGLRVAGIACFVLPVDPSGAIPEGFNIPLAYLVENAGVRDEFGIGAIKVASRAQCPVPWVALKLWEPEAASDGPVALIQRAVLLNRLGLRSIPAAGPGLGSEAGADTAVEEADDSVPMPPAVSPQSPQAAIAARTAAPIPRAAGRQELRQVEQGYLEQIRKFRGQVLELKVALRAERERSRRLQALLRGEV